MIKLVKRQVFQAARRIGSPSNVVWTQSEHRPKGCDEVVPQSA